MSASMVALIETTYATLLIDPIVSDNYPIA